MAQVHLSEQLATFQQGVGLNHCHRVVVGVGSEVDLLSQVVVHDFLDVVVYLLVQSKETNCESLPWQDSGLVERQEIIVTMPGSHQELGFGTDETHILFSVFVSGLFVDVLVFSEHLGCKGLVL
jgi:hypothetical protein